MKVKQLIPYLNKSSYCTIVVLDPQQDKDTYVITDRYRGCLQYAIPEEYLECDIAKEGVGISCQSETFLICVRQKRRKQVKNE